MQAIAFLLLIAMGSIIYFGMKFILDSALAFHEEADKIEDMINACVDSAIVKEKLIKLSQKSFHRSTTKRLMELFTIFEKRYGKSINE